MLRAKKLAKNRSRFSKKHLWWIIPLTGVFVLLLVQILWPNDLTRPFSKIGNQDIGLKSKSELSESIQKEFSSAQIILNLDGEKKEFELASIGAGINTEFIDSNIFNYDFPEKLIPFSLFFGDSINYFELKFDDNVLNEFIKKYALGHKIEAKDSTIRLDELGRIEVINSVEGREIDTDNLNKKIKNTVLVLGEKSEIKVYYNVVNPKVPTEKLEISKHKAENILASKFVFRLEKEDGDFHVVQKIYSPNRVQVASWLSFDENGDLKINDENFKTYIVDLNKELEIPSTPTIINVVDGRENDRQEGSKGQRVSFEKMKQDVSDFLKGERKESIFKLHFEEVSSPEQKKYSYTNSQAGLQAKVNEIGRRYNVRISLKQLNGAGWEANYRENESTPSASTYKLFVAIKLFDEMKKGNRNWDSEILGLSTRECFHQMIIISVNACAEEWIKQFGRTNINNFAYGFGISSNTNFNSYDAIRTSALDLRKTVEKIYSGEMVQGENRRIFLEHLNRQKWRSGIPTGSQGKVYDKVGFLWDYVHDVAIVEHPRGTYALSLMTKGANYSIIAQITRELETFMYP